MFHFIELGLEGLTFPLEEVLDLLFVPGLPRSGQLFSKSPIIFPPRHLIGLVEIETAQVGRQLSLHPGIELLSASPNQQASFSRFLAFQTPSFLCVVRG